MNDEILFERCTSVFADGKPRALTYNIREDRDWVLSTAERILTVLKSILDSKKYSEVKVIITCKEIDDD